MHDEIQASAAGNAGTTKPPTTPGAGSLPPAQDCHKRPLRRIGVVGLGRMGQVLALTLLSNGYQVVAYDRDPQRMASLYGEGARVAGRLGDLATCDAVLSSLPNDEALASVALGPEGLVGVMMPGSLHLSTSTVSPALSRKLEKAHRARGQGFAAAAIVGNPDLARARRIFVLASGAEDALTRARPLLESLGQRLFALGEDAGAANVMKLACNVLTAATLQSMGEVMALLRKCGMDPQQTFEVLTGTLFDGRVHKAYGSKIVAERYSPAGMATPLAVKDLRLALAEAEGRAVPMPVASVVHDRLVALVARGWADLDWSALGALAASDAGLGETAADPAASA